MTPEPEPEYRARILVDVVLLPDEHRGTKQGATPDERAFNDACDIKSYLEDQVTQDRIDQDGARGRIIGASIQDVRPVLFGHPVPPTHP